MRFLPRLMAMLVLASACTTADGAEPGLENGPVSRLMFPDDTDARAAHSSIENSKVECMGRQGFDYDPEPWEDLATLPVQTLRSQEHRGKWGLVDGPPDEDDGRILHNKNTSIFESLSTAEQEKWIANLEGCTEHAYEAESAEANAVLDRVVDDLVQITDFSHPDLQQSLDQWRRCMTTAGYSFDDPNQMMDYSYEITDTGPGVNPDEIALALADRECSMSSIWPAVDIILSDLDHEVEIGSVGSSD